ncbi:DNA-invertase hin [Limimaricola soesokkakensis]|uniref:DNA-invertase hin n=1 Tax=Limimaricola soesokkakensis TaxID=1343159 RepID=A0A1X7A7S7_9RHOB|nr:DNA-invertase hin [Limimaricola soesokkakensis]
MATLGRGDVLVVVRIDRLARSLSHLLEVIETLEAKGAHFRSLGDPIDTTSAQGKFTLQILGATAVFERALIRERTLAVLATARKKAASAAIRGCGTATQRRSPRCAGHATAATSAS